MHCNLKIKWLFKSLKFYLDILIKIHTSSSTSALVNKINVFNAVTWINSAWQNAKHKTIKNYFYKAGFCDNDEICDEHFF